MQTQQQATKYPKSQWTLWLLKVGDAGAEKVGSTYRRVPQIPTAEDAGVEQAHPSPVAAVLPLSLMSLSQSGPSRCHLSVQDCLFEILDDETLLH